MAKDDVKEKAQADDAPAGIDPKYLKGIKFTGAVEKEVTVDGVAKKKYIPFERDCTPADVLDWKDRGAVIGIVVKDGRKYQVEKK